MSAKIYGKDGKETGTIALPLNVFGAKWNADLVHQVVVSMQSNARAGTAHTKFRGEVAGGGKKPWKQKGTGRARHGSTRSPIWTGGGVSGGPRSDMIYTKKINSAMRKKALAVVLSKKLALGEVIFVDSFGFSAPKAKDARTLLTNLGSVAAALPSKRKNAALIALTSRDEAAEKSFRNFGNVEVVQVKDMNPVQILSKKYILFADAEAAVKALENRIVSK